MTNVGYWELMILGWGVVPTPLWNTQLLSCDP
jgi:hypothetical protein